MEYAAWPIVKDNVGSRRQGAAGFLDNLPINDSYGVTDRQIWVARWTKTGDDDGRAGDLNIKKGAFDKATEAWLGALTAFEVARRLIGEDDPQGADISAKIEAGIHRFGVSLKQRVEQVQIACCDQTEVLAHYFSAGKSSQLSPAVICISSEGEAGATLLGRLLPVAIDRGISILVVSHNGVTSRWYGQSEILLSCCLDYLSGRPDIDATRIGIYGEGLSAVLATDFAASDRRVAAAVCDGGLWNWARISASIGWMARNADALDQDALSARRSQFVRRLKCPVLVVAGGRGLVSVSEAIELQADCLATRVDLELAIPRMIRTPVGEIENFVTSDDCIFCWLKQKLAHS